MNSGNKKLMFLYISIFICAAANAQIEAAYLKTKDFQGIGFGAFINVGLPISDANELTTELGGYYATGNGDNVALGHILVGYRNTFNGTGYGLYAEPFAGYTIGVTDIPKDDPNGPGILYSNGKQVDEKASGITTGLGFGYIFQPWGRLVFNIGLRYEHIFTFHNDPSVNLFSLRFTHRLSYKKRED